MSKEQLADEFDVDLPSMPKETDVRSKPLHIFAGGKISELPERFTRDSAILPDYRAFIVNEVRERSGHHNKYHKKIDIN